MNFKKLNDANKTLQLSKSKGRASMYRAVAYVLFSIGIIALIVGIASGSVGPGIFSLIFFSIFASLFLVASKINENFVKRNKVENESQLKLTKKYLKETKDAIMKK